MKAILMSIRPQHARDIMNGDKTIELRKRFPKDFRGWVYCYCTKAIKGKPALIRSAFRHAYKLDTCYVDGYEINLSGKVVGRVWVDKVDTYYVESDMIWLLDNKDNRLATSNKIEQDILIKSCVNLEDFKKYAKPINDKRKRLFAIHFSKLEIFDKPKELGEFVNATKYAKAVHAILEESKQVQKLTGYGSGLWVIAGQMQEAKQNCYLKSAPQSYMYVKVEE